MASEQLNKLAVQIKLNNGTSPTGLIKTKNVTLQNVSQTGYTPTLADNVVSSLSYLFEQSVYATNVVKTYELVN